MYQLGGLVERCQAGEGLVSGLAGFPHSCVTATPLCFPTLKLPQAVFLKAVDEIVQKLNRSIAHKYMCL